MAADRELQESRRVRRGRVVDVETGQRYREEYAKAVVGPDGEPITYDIQEVLVDIRDNLRKVLMHLEVLTGEQI